MDSEPSLGSCRHWNSAERCRKLYKSGGLFALYNRYNVQCWAIFLTTTCYKHLKLTDRKTGQHPSLPGPALLHVKENTGQFTYFTQSLQEINSRVSDILIIGSDRFKGFANGFKTLCHILRSIVCKKHTENDIQRKMTALGIGPQARGEYLKDIFGDHKQNMAGLIDASSAEDFDTKLHSLTSVWEKREKEARGTSQPEFSRYFATYLAEEMKEKMILPVRREAGLGDEFFYDNAVESINRKFKTKIREQKTSTNVSGFKSLNCT